METFQTLNSKSKAPLPLPSRRPNHRDQTAMIEQLPVPNQLWHNQPLAIWWLVWLKIFHQVREDGHGRIEALFHLIHISNQPIRRIDWWLLDDQISTKNMTIVDFYKIFDLSIWAIKIQHAFTQSQINSRGKQKGNDEFSKKSICRIMILTEWKTQHDKYQKLWIFWGTKVSK